MPSKYQAKHPRKQPKQGKTEWVPKAYPICTDCGRRSAILSPAYSKCFCGGTYQLYGASSSRGY